MNTVDAKVKYQFMISGLRGKKVKVFREVGTKEWQTFSQAATRTGRDRQAVMDSITAGRPITVPSKHYLVVGGEFDGLWFGFAQLARLTGSSPSHCARLKNDETATIVWRAPNPKMVEAGNKGCRQKRVFSRPAKLDGVCHVAAKFNRIQLINY